MLQTDGKKDIKTNATENIISLVDVIKIPKAKHALLHIHLQSSMFDFMLTLISYEAITVLRLQ